jgi:hypothetical protein
MILEEAESDLLLLLDCCAAASGAPEISRRIGVTETIAACGFESIAPQPGRFSFTNTLIQVLEDWKHTPAFTAAFLHCEILKRLRREQPEPYRKIKKFEHRRTPVHVVSTRDPNARSIQFCPVPIRLNSAEDLATPGPVFEVRGIGMSIPLLDKEQSFTESHPSLTIKPQSLMEDPPYDMDTMFSTLNTGRTRVPHVLISLALEEEPDIDDDVESWKRWLQAFPALARYVRIQGVYKSNSTLLILSLPVAVWNWLPKDFACIFIGYVHSKNHLEAQEYKTAPEISPSKISKTCKHHSESKKLNVSSLPRDTLHISNYLFTGLFFLVVC